MNGTPDMRQGRRCRDHREISGSFSWIMRKYRHDHLSVAAPAVGEQRTDRPVNQARDQCLAFGRATFALEIAARNAPGGEKLFLVVAGERQEIDALLGYFAATTVARTVVSP